MPSIVVQNDDCAAGSLAKLTKRPQELPDFEDIASIIAEFHTEIGRVNREHFDPVVADKPFQMPDVCPVAELRQIRCDHEVFDLAKCQTLTDADSPRGTL